MRVCPIVVSYSKLPSVKRKATPRRSRHEMNDQDRRKFLKRTGTGVAGVAVLGSSIRSAAARGANERVNVGLIGCGGRGITVAKALGTQKDATGPGDQQTEGPAETSR